MLKVRKFLWLESFLEDVEWWQFVFKDCLLLLAKSHTLKID